jgi:hypothetical protein
MSSNNQTNDNADEGGQKIIEEVPENETENQSLN